MTSAKPYMGELKAGDERLIKPVVEGLKTKINKRKAIGLKTMCAKMTKAGYEITQSRLKQVIHVIRVRGLVKCLVDGPKGYYITASMRDGQRITSEMRRSIKLIQAEETALTEQFNEYYSPQLFH